MIKPIIALFLFAILLPACAKQSELNAQSYPYNLVDSLATAETKALYKNLKELSEVGIMFGHHDANAYGHSWKDQRNRSDVKDVCGSHPAVFGHDFSSITNLGTRLKEQKTNEDKLRELITEAYLLNGVNTITWHFNNPGDPEDGSFYWSATPVAVLPDLLPNGEKHEVYKEILTRIATFAKSCKGRNGELIPMIFRPYHEYDGDWFWWGVPFHASVEEFKALWTFTVCYLRDTLGVHNFIYAISPDCRFKTKEEFLKCYPGDAYVDMIGIDNYWDLRPDGGTEQEFIQKLDILDRVAKEKNKLAALTETGSESIKNPRWWTDVLLRLMTVSSYKLSYVMLWRNAYDHPTHYYAPFPGHPSVPNFIEFRNDKRMRFLDDLPFMYR